MTNIITQQAIETRLHWIQEIVKISGHFGSDSSRIEAELSDEIKKYGVDNLLAHLRLCSAIPESYGHDTSEEKLYSKYTDALISQAYNNIGLKSIVLTERADCADVEVVSDTYSFVADAKVFRLSRTAKNQKDFKVQAMDNWKRGKPFAMIVCPLYQLPSKSSQIYQQAGTRNVCIFSYPHLAVLVRFAQEENADSAKELLYNIFQSVSAMHPSKDANAYWQIINKTMLAHHNIINNLWRDEKIATLESIKISKEIALSYYASERQRIMSMSHDQAIKELIDMHKIDSRIETIKAVSDNHLMSIN